MCPGFGNTDPAAIRRIINEDIQTQKVLDELGNFRPLSSALSCDFRTQIRPNACWCIFQKCCKMLGVTFSDCDLVSYGLGIMILHYKNTNINIFVA